MAKLAKMTGMKAVLKNFERATLQYQAKIRRGLKLGGIYLQRKSQQIVPVQLGPLKASAFTRDIGTVRRPDVIVGYTANYAVFVHEDLEKAHGQAFNIKHGLAIAGASKNAKTAKGGLFLRGENQQAKFLEKPAREERIAILDIIHSKAKS